MKNINNELKNIRPIVGIDLGTTNSSVAYINPKGKPEIIPSFKGEKLIPSVILIDLNGQVVVGQDAKDAVIAMPQRTLTAVKRKMGQSVALSIADKTLLPQEASALILKELKKYVDAALGEGEKEAVITVPAYFTDEQRRATKQAGEIAGFVVERIINEPTAAALVYGLNNLRKNAHILVYDLGGGTFDVSVVEMMKGILEVKSSAGNNFLGGEDFDWKLVDFLADYMIEKYQVDPREHIQAKSILKSEAEKIKILLSEVEKTEIAIPIVMVQDQKPLGIYTEITREQFEEMIKGMLDETMASVEKALVDAELEASEINHVLLVGGSTAIPRVSQLLEEYFQKPPKKEIHPDEAVALGAAVQAGIKSGALADKQLIATDVAPFAMGVAVLKEWRNFQLKPGGFYEIISRNTTIPVKKTEQFITSYDGQTAVSVEVYQGDQEWVEQNHLLGEFLLDGIPPNAAGNESINITFYYNLNGILEVTAESESTGKQVSVNLQDQLKRDSMDAFMESVAKIEDILETKVTDLPQDDEFDEDLSYEEFDLEPEYFEDEGYLDLENADISELIDELHSLKDEMESQTVPIKNTHEFSVKRVENLIKQALKKKDKDLLIEAIEETTDLLIKFELD